MAFEYLAEEDFTGYVCQDCGAEREEQILMGTLVCLECGGVMLPF
jgi:DNA-directed RNA polymerase subunit RPC12/RpoP